MNYNFLQLLHFFTDILSTVNKISEQLQDLRLDLAKACQLISTLQQELECRRNVDMINYNEEVESLCRKCGSNYEENEHRSQRPPDALSDYFATDAIGKSTRANSEKPLHGNAFIQILDCMLSELDRRFSCDAKVIMQGVSALSPTSESFLDHSALKEIALRYGICHDGLIQEIPLVKRLVSNDCKSVLEFLTQLYPYKQSFDCLYNLLLISVTLPVTTASCERSFSCHERLSHLALLTMESTRAESIDLEQFFDEFDPRHDNHRIKLH